jgi:hypothetical protein
MWNTNLRLIERVFGSIQLLGLKEFFELPKEKKWKFQMFLRILEQFGRRHLSLEEK